MEVWDAYTKERVRIEGVTLERSAFPYPEEYYHLAVNVWIRDQNGSWLFMKRSHTKEHHPNVYECGAGGSVLQGESSIEAALREVVEETGLTSNKIEFLFSFTEEEHRTHYDCFLLNLEMIQPQPIYQLTETDDHMWVADAQLPSFLDTYLVFQNQKQQLLTYLQTESR